MERAAKVEIMFDPESVGMTDGGTSVHAVMPIRVDATVFPDRCWDDSVLSIAAMWMTALHNLLLGANLSSFAFMDGPYSFDVGVAKDGAWRLTLLDSHKKPPIQVWDGWCDQHLLVDALLVFCRELIQVCLEKGIGPPLGLEAQVMEVSRLVVGPPATS